jgi:hypothetical protein
MNTHASEVRDLDHVVMPDGRIYRVVGNLDHPAKFVGYNVYSPHPSGDWDFRGTPYRKNFTEDDELPQDALDTYVMLPKARICEHLDPHIAAAEKASTFAGPPWAALRAELTTLFGPDAVGIFGSAMLGMHLTPNGQVRKDVDFVIEGSGNIPVLRERLPAIRSKLGFTEGDQRAAGPPVSTLPAGLPQREQLHRPRHQPPVDRLAGPERDRHDHPLPRPSRPPALPAGRLSGCARNSLARGSTPGRRPPPGTWNSTTRSRSPRRPSAGS